MQDPILMNVLESDADFEEKAPDLFLLEGTLVLQL